MDSVVNSNVFNSVSIPEIPMVGSKEFSDFSVRFVSLYIDNLSKKRNPIVFGRACSAGSFEIFSVNVEFSITNVNQNVELVFSLRCEEVVL